MLVNLVIFLYIKSGFKVSGRTLQNPTSVLKPVFPFNKVCTVKVIINRYDIKSVNWDTVVITFVNYNFCSYGFVINYKGNSCNIQIYNSVPQSNTIHSYPWGINIYPTKGQTWSSPWSYPLTWKAFFFSSPTFLYKYLCFFSIYSIKKNI